MTRRITRRGQVTLPKEVRDAVGLRPGDEVEVRAFEVGAADFIRKPVKNSVLLARVAKVLREP
jgi:AbrB family looped-hinge helix DNA binding protein